jgi:hypothetical protein
MGGLFLPNPTHPTYYWWAKGLRKVMPAVKLLSSLNLEIRFIFYVADTTLI